MYIDCYSTPCRDIRVSEAIQSFLYGPLDVLDYERDKNVLLNRYLSCVTILDHLQEKNANDSFILASEEHDLFHLVGDN